MNNKGFIRAETIIQIKHLQILIALAGLLAICIGIGTGLRNEFDINILYLLSGLHIATGVMIISLIWNAEKRYRLFVFLILSTVAFFKGIIYLIYGLNFFDNEYGLAGSIGKTSVWWGWWATGFVSWALVIDDLLDNYSLYLKIKRNEKEILKEINKKARLKASSTL